MAGLALTNMRRPTTIGVLLGAGGGLKKGQAGRLRSSNLGARCAARAVRETRAAGSCLERTLSPLRRQPPPTAANQPICAAFSAYTTT